MSFNRLCRRTMKYFWHLGKQHFNEQNEIKNTSKYIQVHPDTSKNCIWTKRRIDRWVFRNLKKSYYVMLESSPKTKITPSYIRRFSITLKNLYANYKKFFEVETYENGIRHFTKHLNPSLSTQFQNVYNLWLNKIETVVY